MKLPSKFGTAAEKRVAKLTNSRRTPGSGSRWSQKGDLKNITHLTEVKATASKSYTLKLKTLLKIEREAAAQDREPSFVIEFTDPGGRHHYFNVERHYGRK
jgi:hypothetical protein